MNEAETRAEHIDPALMAAGWGVVEGSKILREYPITQGRLEGLGKRAQKLIADSIRALPVKGERRPGVVNAAVALGVSIRALPVKGERLARRSPSIRGRIVSIRALPVKGERLQKAGRLACNLYVSIRALPVKGERPARRLPASRSR